MAGAAVLPTWRSTLAIVKPDTDGEREPALGRGTDPRGAAEGWVRVAKRTIQKYMRSVRERTPGGRRWFTFVRNHADAIWCCDFVRTYDLFFPPVFAFIIVHLGSRRVVHSATTRNPTQDWGARWSSP